MRGRARLRRWKRKRSNDKKEEKEIYAAGGFAPRPAGWGLGGRGGCVSSERPPPPRPRLPWGSSLALTFSALLGERKEQREEGKASFSCFEAALSVCAVCNVAARGCNLLEAFAALC